MLIGTLRALAGGPLVSTTTFDPANVPASVTLSNGNLTATCFTGTSAAHVRSIASHSAGKYFASVLLGALPNPDEVAIGLSNASAVSFLGSNNNSMGYYDDGPVRRGFSTIATFHVFVPGDVIDSATDLDNGKQWWRVNGGGWNNDILANQNPATNTGGIDISVSPPPPLFYSVELDDVTDAVTVNFGATAYAFAPPAGFGNW